MGEGNYFAMAAMSLAAAGVATALLTPAVARMARRLGSVDKPAGRRAHTESIPRMGGVAIVAGIVFGVLAAAVLSSAFPIHRLVTDKALVFLAAAALIFALGVTDDLRGLGALTKFPVQILAASLIVSSGTLFEVARLPFYGPLDLGLLAPVITVVWIVGVTNAINLLDGLDGLAAGLAAIIAMGVCILFVARDSDPRALAVVAATAGACAGFLFFNWHPAKIFMGDSGSLTLGFILAVGAVQCSVKSSTAVAAMIPILALGLPVFDTLLVMAYRFTKSPAKTPFARAARMFRGDRNHLHFLLARLMMRRKHIVLALYAFCAIFTAMALLVALTNNPLLGIISLGIGGLAVLIVRQAGLKARLREDTQAGREVIRADWGERTRQLVRRASAETDASVEMLEADSSS